MLNNTLMKKISYIEWKEDKKVDISKPGHFIEIRVSDQVEPFLRRTRGDKV